MNTLKSTLKRIKIFKQTQWKNINFKSNIGNTSYSNRSILLYNRLSNNFTSTIKSNKDKTREEEERIEENLSNFMKNPDEIIKKTNEIIKSITTNLKQNQIEGIVQKMREIIENPIGISTLSSEVSEFKREIYDKISSLKINDIDTLIIFIQFLDIIDYNVSKDTQKYLIYNKEYQSLFETMNTEQISFISYYLSKYMIDDKFFWDLVIRKFNNDKSLFNIGQLCRILLGLVMIPNILYDGMSNNKNSEQCPIIVQDILKYIELDLKNITYIDVFRLSMALSKKTFNNRVVSQKIWNTINSVLLSNLSKFDLYQLSNILVLLSEFSYCDQHSFSKIEKEVIKSVLNKIDSIDNIHKDKSIDHISPDQSLNNKSEIDYKELLEDYSLLLFSFAYNRSGSENFWMRSFEFILLKKQFLSSSSIENIIFSCYRLEGFGFSEEAEEMSVKVLIELEDIIINKRLLSENVINPFNVMMPFARINRYNQKIWEDIVKNVYNVISNPQFKPNSFVMADLIYAFSSYLVYIKGNLANQKDVQMNKSLFYYLNYIKIWKHIDELLLKTEFNEISSLSNIILDITSMNDYKELIVKSFSSLLKSIETIFNDDKLKSRIDSTSFTILCISISRIEYSSLPHSTLNCVVNYFVNNSHLFDLEQIKKITLCFLRYITDIKFWMKIDEAVSNIIAKSGNNSNNQKNIVDLEYVNEVMVPFAVIGIKNPVIWRKFTELILKDPRIFENNDEFIMNIIFSFPRSKAIGYLPLWKKIFSYISSKLDTLELDDLSHISLCLDERFFIDNQEVHYLLFASKEGKGFWERLVKLIEKRIDNKQVNISSSTCSSILKAFNENPCLNHLCVSSFADKETVKAKVEMRLRGLIGEDKKI